MNTLSNKNIINVWTRIFHENQNLKYEISIQLSDGTSQVFQVFTDYQKYRKKLDELVKAKDNDDYILSTLCTSILDRKLPKIIIQDDEFSEEQLKTIKDKFALNFKVYYSEIDYFVDTGIIKNQAYDLNHNSISILYKNEQIKDLTKASDHMNLLALTRPVIKHFVYYPKS